jgi:Fe2+ transport system protein B
MKQNKPTRTRQIADVIMYTIVGALFMAGLMWLVYFFGFQIEVDV